MKFPKITKKRVLLVALLLVVVGLVTVVVRDNYRHNQLSSSIDGLQSSLEEKGINAEKTSGCGRTPSKIGSGAKVCSISLNATVSTPNVNAANALLKTYEETLRNNRNFDAIRNLPDAAINEDNLPFGSGIYQENHSNRECTARHNYDEDSGGTRLSISCNDTSWFTRTFNL